MSDQKQRTQWALDVFAGFVRIWTPDGALALVTEAQATVAAAIRAISPLGHDEPVGWAVFRRELDTTYNHRDHPSGYVHTIISAVFDKPGQADTVYQSVTRKHPAQEFVIGEIRQQQFSKDR